MTAFTLLGRLSARCWNIAAGTCFHSATRALVMLGTDAGQLGLARSLHFNSSQRCAMGLRSKLCAGQLSSSTPISTNYLCLDTALCTGALSSCIKKGPSPNWAPDWCRGLRHCIAVLEASLQTLVRFQAESQPAVIGSPIGRHTIGPLSSRFGRCRPSV